MQGWRKRMEDSHISDLNFNKNAHLFGVFDGHGGKEVAQFVKKHFTDELKKNKNYQTGVFKKALIETFLKMDDMCLDPSYQIELKEEKRLSKEEDDRQDKSNPNKQNEIYAQLMTKIDNEDSIAMFTGCTATVCLFQDNKFYFANAGDSRIVLAKKGIAYPMTIDHKPELDSEKNRIYKAEGWVAEGRVKGNLNLSRSLGDMEYKQNKKLKPEEQMITAYPEISEEVFGDDCDFIILGCDGIWDCKTNQEAVDFVSERLKKDPNTKLSLILESMLDQIVATDIYNGMF
jgi:protein phosphatase 1G